jgi:hypothetical protein
MSSAELSAPWWKVALVVVVCIAVGAFGAIAITDGGGDPSDPAAASPVALEALSDRNVEVVVVISEGPLSAVTGTPQPEASDFNTAVTITERGVVDFAAGSASTTPTDSDDEEAMMASGEPAVTPSTFADGELRTEWARLYPGVTLDGVEDTWVRTGLLPPGLESTSSALPTLIDLAGTLEGISSPLTDAGNGVWRATVDPDALDALTNERLESLDPALAELIAADVDSGARAELTGPWEVVVGDDGDIDALRVEMSAGERVVTVTWWIVDTDAAPAPALDGAATDYVTYREAFDAMFVVEGPQEVPDDPNATSGG